MKKTEVKDYINNNPELYFTRDKSGKGYICPLCDNGSGSDGTGISTEDKIHFKCFKCGFYGDTLDYIGQKEGARSFPEKIEAAIKVCNIPIDGKSSGYTPPKQPEKKAEPEADYTKQYEEWNKHITETDYHRGISLAALNRFKVGYCAKWIDPKTPYDTPTPRLIIPTGKGSYIARATIPEKELPKKYVAHQRAPAVGGRKFLNPAALYQSEKPVFIVEGEIDALSIIDNGGEAVGIGGTSGTKQLLRELKAAQLEGKETATLILALDNDEKSKENTGQKYQAELAAALEELKHPYTEAKYPEGIKDANEYLQKDKEGFRRFISQAIEQAKKAGEDQSAAAEQQKEDTRAQLEAESAAAYMKEFHAFITSKAHHNYTQTGFVELDYLLDGGIYPGLSIIGAVSSLGKTTFALQIADRIASQGRSVVYFSLEMGTAELIAKSISRITFLTAKDRKNAKTTRGIISAQNWVNYTPEELELIHNATDAYTLRIAPNIYFREGMGNIGVDEIAEQIKRHTEATGKAPVVIVDYLQILKPENDRLTDKQATDRAVLALKRLARDYDTQILAISSFNRSNYTEPVNISAFKESGAIEYGSDYCFGLQFAGMDRQPGEIDRERDARIYALIAENNEKAKNGQPQQIELKILKNRNGKKGTVTLDFYPAFNCFKGHSTRKAEAPATMRF